ncbi:hypothetical protein D7W81_19570 [Corallococcus aberystwythensis]|uniref:Uncharacterized protein n=1 Tax=Corallococcus aberystwythensis TaxID=2316722 RepID=A0A3A8Q8N3_9BACT|nr:hypothetical protein D7W81_19570 [Corallococcus aberystwythensis]
MRIGRGPRIMECNEEWIVTQRLRDLLGGQRAELMPCSSCPSGNSVAAFVLAEAACCDDERGDELLGLIAQCAERLRPQRANETPRGQRPSLLFARYTPPTDELLQQQLRASRTIDVLDSEQQRVLR